MSALRRAELPAPAPLLRIQQALQVE